MKLKIEITMNNAAFKPAGNLEAANILRDLADTIEEGSDLMPGYSHGLGDTNGNTVGSVKVTR